MIQQNQILIIESTKKIRHKLNECVDEMRLEDLTVQICSKNPTHHEMNVLDEHITHALDVTREYVEGTKRNVSFTTIKQIK